MGKQASPYLRFKHLMMSLCSQLVTVIQQVRKEDYTDLKVFQSFSLYMGCLFTHSSSCS